MKNTIGWIILLTAMLVIAVTWLNSNYQDTGLRSMVLSASLVGFGAWLAMMAVWLSPRPGGKAKAQKRRCQYVADESGNVKSMTFR